ncbi:MAG TPA: translocation/assembly module TamB domain-containing protein [Ohtaekwangia sp.]|uniref:translocation/assembly module TamB domain-containing protein n=1 Tax=Ohtaekwangia sp. TaxID=2066019 RepID=UPI002F93FD4A
MSEPWRPKKYLIKIAKVLGWFILSVVILLLTVSLLIQVPAVQRRIVAEAVGFLKNKIGTEVRLAHVSLSFPKKVVLEGLYLEDQHRDTLLYIGKLAIDTDLWGLTQKKIELNQIQLDTLHATIHRSPNDSAFNFTYIVEAFTSKDTVAAPTDTTTTPWEFSLEDLAITQARVAFRDSLEKNDVQASLGELTVAIDEFYLNRSVIHADEIALKNVRASVVQQPAVNDSIDSIPDTTSNGTPWSIGFNAIALQTVKARYSNETSRQNILADIAEAHVEAEKFDLNEQIIQLREFSLQRSFIAYHQGSNKNQTATKATPDTTFVQPWYISLNRVDLTDNSLQYYDFNQPAITQGIDFNHLWLTQCTLQAEDLALKGSDVSGEIKELVLQERSGFSVASFKTLFALTGRSVTIEKFHFNTPTSTVNLEARATFPSLETLAEQYADATVQLDMHESSVLLKDILYFVPTLLDSLPIAASPQTRIAAHLSCSGSVKDLTLKELHLQTLTSTQLDAHGTLKGLPDIDKTQMNLSLQKFYTTSHDIASILPDTLLPKSIALPQWINLTGNATGTLNAPEAKVYLTSNIGAIDARGKMNFNKTARENYDAHVAVKKLDIGKLLRDTTMGTLALEASAKGAGFRMEAINAKVNLLVKEFSYNHYTYRDLTVDGTLKKYFFSGDAKMHDKNLDLTLKGDLNYSEDIPLYKFTFNLINADFKALHLTERPLRARGILDVNLATSDFRVLNGHVDIRHVAVFNGSKLYAVDSLLFASIDQQGKSEIEIHSDILSGEFKGNINIFSLPEALQRHINHYFALHDSVFDKPVEPQNFDFNLVIKNTDLLTEIIFPDLEPFVPGQIAGEFDSEAKRLWLAVKLARINYAGLRMDSIVFGINSNEQSLDYTFEMKKLHYDTLRMEALKLAGSIMNDSIYTRFTILDSLQKEKYILGGVFNSYKNDFQFRFLQDQLMLNYEPWKTPLYNTLRFTGNGVTPNNFYIAKGDERILLFKKEDKDSTLNLSFHEVDMKNITSLVEGATPLKGIIDGDLNMGSAQSASFNTTLYIHKLAILDRPWGDLSLALGKTADGPLNIDLRAEGSNMELVAAGYITSQEEQPKIHFKTSLTRLDLAAIEPLTMKQVKNMKGSLTGEVKIEGYTSKPAIDGILTFKEATFTPAIIGSKFLLENESIQLTGSGLTLSKFKIKDDKNNIAVIDGSIKTTTFRSFDLALTLNADDFQLINTTEDDNDLFYGNVRINTKARITGTSDFPKVQMNASLSKGSEFTYIVPQTQKTILEQEGIVKFVDRDAEKDPFLSSIQPEDTVTSKFTGIDLSANIELTDGETFNIIVDPATGDKLSVKGNSTLTFGIDETGDMELSGRYEITQGTYNLSFYKLVKREFSIEKGSTITWSGDLLQPEMNIRALYKVETSPIDLVASQLTSSSAEEFNTYRQRLPFEVYLIIEGNLLTPDIHFQLDMPQDKQNAFGGTIYAKIKDINTRESDLNKQVFALLILKRFISDNPLESQGGSDMAATARTSVSRILSDQLNRLSENIKGVQLSFDVKSYEDYTSGRAEGQTELQLGLSKSLLNNRLVVKVSGNVDVEGNTSNQSSLGDYIGDLALEYKLTEDGRLRITGFRNSNYDMIDGELIETGAGIIYIKDYDTLRELFKANAKQN